MNRATSCSLPLQPVFQGFVQGYDVGLLHPDNRDRVRILDAEDELFAILRRRDAHRPLIINRDDDFLLFVKQVVHFSSFLPALGLTPLPGEPEMFAFAPAVRPPP